MVTSNHIPERITDDFLIERACLEISAYLKQGENFPHLVSRLGECIHQLENVSQDTKEQLDQIWIKLETLNALALADSPHSPNQEDVDKILMSALNLLEAIERG